MLIDFQDLSSVKKSVTVEVPAGAVADEVRTVTTEFGRQAKIPGFRPGKIPVEVVRKRFITEIKEEASQRLLPRFFHEALADKGLAPVGNPHVTKVDPVAEGAPLRFTAEFEVKPIIDLRDYTGLEITNPDTTLPESSVDEVIERLRAEATSFRKVEDRAAQDGDWVSYKIDFFGEGVDSHSDEGNVQIGSEDIFPELHHAIRGKREGELVEFDKVFDESCEVMDLRGKTIHHRVTITGLHLAEKPELDDKFALSAGNWESVDAMRAKIREDLQHHRNREAQQEKRVEIGERLIALHPIEAPEILVEEELGKTLQNYARYLVSQGVDLDRAAVDWEKLSDEFRLDATKRVKRSLILEAIARKEKMLPSDVEVDAEIRKASSDGRGEFAEVKQRLRRDGGYEALRVAMMQDRALQMLLKKAVYR